MRTSAVVLSIAVALMTGIPASAGTRASCIALCEATAQACLAAAHTKYDGCKPAARTTCAPKPPSEMFACLTTALKSCVTTRSDEEGPCRETFKSCYAACGPGEPRQTDFWCELDASSTATDVKTRKQVFCGGSAGKSGDEQWAHCAEPLKPTDPTVGYSLECTPLN